MRLAHWTTSLPSDTLVRTSSSVLLKSALSCLCFQIDMTTSTTTSESNDASENAVELVEACVLDPQLKDLVVLAKEFA